MSTAETGDDSALHVPAEILPAEEPPIEYVLDVCGSLTVLRPANNPNPSWKNPDPAARAESFLRWAETPRPPAPDIPLEFLDREHIYD
jgi:hypothetical protein